MTGLKRFWTIPFFVIVGALCGLAYCAYTIPLYEISGSVGLLRPTLPPVSNYMPETQNRWVWIRDGLAMKNMLLQDSVLYDVIQSSEVLKERLELFSIEFPALQKDDLTSNFINKLKKSIKIQYTGGDANIFIFTVKDANPGLAKEIVSQLMSQLKSLYEEAMFKRNSLSLDELHVKTLALKQEIGMKSKNDTDSYLQSRLNAAYDAEAKLYVENILQNIQSKALLKTINDPYIPTHPIWPRWDLLIFFSTLTGLLIGVTFYYLISRSNE